MGKSRPSVVYPLPTPLGSLGLFLFNGHKDDGLGYTEYTHINKTNQKHGCGRGTGRNEGGASIGMGGRFWDRELECIYSCIKLQISKLIIEGKILQGAERKSVFLYQGGKRETQACGDEIFLSHLVDAAFFQVGNWKLASLPCVER